MDTITVTVTVDYNPRGYEVENHTAGLRALAVDLEQAARRLARRHVLGEVTASAEISNEIHEGVGAGDMTQARLACDRAAAAVVALQEGQWVGLASYFLEALEAEAGKREVFTCYGFGEEVLKAIQAEIQARLEAGGW